MSPRWSREAAVILLLASLSAAPPGAFAEGADPPLASSQPATSASDRYHCTADRTPPPRLDQVLRQLAAATPAEAACAAVRLGHRSDPRAVAPLAHAASYGAFPELRKASRAALAELAATPSVRSAVKRVAEEDPDLEIRGVATQALADATAAPTTQTPKWRLEDPDPTRVAYSPTAFTRKVGEWNWTIYNLAYWGIDYGVTDQIEVGLHTLPPVGVVAVLPHIKLSAQLSEHAAVALYVTAGAFYPYLFSDEGLVALAYGGGPIITLGTPDLFLNIGIPAYGLTGGREKVEYGVGAGEGRRSWDLDTEWSATPNVGVGWRFARRVKVNVELFLPVGNYDDVGKIWLLIYGVRVFDEHIYGDINFVVPFSPYMEEYLKYIPIGFPLLAFGFQW